MTSSETDKHQGTEDMRGDRKGWWRYPSSRVTQHRQTQQLCCEGQIWMGLAFRPNQALKWGAAVGRKTQGASAEWRAPTGPWCSHNERVEEYCAHFLNDALPETRRDQRNMQMIFSGGGEAGYLKTGQCETAVSDSTRARRHCHRFGSNHVPLSL